MQSPVHNELEQAERLAVQRAVSQDGLCDIFCGLCLAPWVSLFVPVVVGCVLLVRFLGANPVVEPAQELR